MIEIVHSEGIVRARAAEPVAFFSVGDVAVGAGIDQKAASLKGEANAEGVSVAVARVTCSLRPGIDHHLLSARLMVVD